MSHLISESELEVALSGLPGWSVEENQLVKRFTFSSFRDAIAAIVRISFEAEDSNHHPQIKNDYNALELRLCTHDAGDKLTDKDLKMATKIEELLSQGCTR
jgi:4a-hydroxytetrahydrobiopterin dehydratase